MPAAPVTFSGSARVVDGDTLWVGKTKVRLFGVDAVEHDQTCTTEQGVRWACGEWVGAEVRALYQGRRLDCEALDTDRYGRTVARCRDRGEDIAARLVGAGLVRAYPRYSMDYVALEGQARAADRGLWSGTSMAPEAFRHRAAVTPVTQANEAPPSPDCAIKGNISKSGRIYHLPGGKWYTKTRIDTRAGERWFCSVEEAEAAGWRAPRG